MSSDTHDDPRSVAIATLTALGLSTYAARTFVALASLGVGTAKDVSEVADVPRTRVYDAVDELVDRSLVDVHQSNPKEFLAVSPETTRRKFEEEYRDRTGTLESALADLEPVERREKQRGVWTVTGQEAVTDRVLEFFRSAEEEIVYMTVEELLTDEIVDALEDAGERGVSVKLGGGSAEVKQRIREQVPNAELLDSLWLWSDTSAGRLMLVDREKTLAGVLVEEGSTGNRSETAIWGVGESNSLVVVLQAIFAWRLDEATDG